MYPLYSSVGNFLRIFNLAHSQNPARPPHEFQYSIVESEAQSMPNGFTPELSPFSFFFPQIHFQPPIHSIGRCVVSIGNERLTQDSFISIKM